MDIAALKSHEEIIDGGKFNPRAEYFIRARHVACRYAYCIPAANRA